MNVYILAVMTCLRKTKNIFLAIKHAMNLSQLSDISFTLDHVCLKQTDHVIFLIIITVSQSEKHLMFCLVVH